MTPTTKPKPRPKDTRKNRKRPSRKRPTLYYATEENNEWYLYRFRSASQIPTSDFDPDVVQAPTAGPFPDFYSAARYAADRKHDLVKWAWIRPHTNEIVPGQPVPTHDFDAALDAADAHGYTVTECYFRLGKIKLLDVDTL